MMADAHTDLVVRIKPFDKQGQFYPVEAELDDDGRLTQFERGQLKLDQPALLTFQLNAEAYGMALFDALFAADMRRAYEAAATTAEVKTGGRLRIHLRIDNDAVKLHAIPWERLYHPDRGHNVNVPLAASALTPFSRYTSLEIAEPTPVAEVPIRMLVALSNPVDLSELPTPLAAVKVEEEIDNLLRALGELQRQDKVQVTILPGRTGLSPELRAKLERDGCKIAEGTTNLFNIAPLLAKTHIFHFIGHGLLRQERAFLILEKADGRAIAVQDEEIVSMFAALGTLPHLMFLVACESAKREETAESPWVGLAPKLVQAGVPAVVAMQDLVPMEMSRLLAGEFYTRLAEHGEVDRALNQARLQVFDRKQTEWAIPVLFMRIRKGRLFGEEQDSEAPAPGHTPFKGLEYFTENDADRFYGREMLTAELVGRLRTSRFLPVIIGSSGSGKSSVVRAGVLPALKRGEPLADGTLPPEGSTTWLQIPITPTAQPLEALAAALTSDVDLAATTTLVDDLRNNERALHFAARKLLSRKGNSRLLLVVDQFEEVFTQCKDEAERKAFIDNLLHASSEETDGPTIVIIIFRADFYANCAQYDNLRIAVSTKQEFVGPMNRNDLRRAIEEPARRGSWELEKGLVDTILEEMGDEPGALPLMQHALLETWNRRRGRVMTFRGYREAGGIKGAIAKTAESVYNGLTPDEQTIARRIFLQLVEVSEDAPDTRHRAQLEDLYQLASDKQLVDSVLDKLVKNRLVVKGETTAEVAHEALIREWQKLREWLKTDRKWLTFAGPLNETAKRWESDGDSGLLYRGLRLEEARDWASQPDYQAEMSRRWGKFLEASEAESRRELETAQRMAEAEKKRAEAEKKRADEQRRLSRIIAGVAAVAIVAAFIAGALGVIARQQANLALSSKLDTQASVLPATRLDLQLLLRALAYDTASTQQVRDNLQESLKKTAGLRFFLRGHTKKITSLAFSPKSDRAVLASGSQDNTVRLWDVKQGTPIGDPLTGHTDQVRSVAFNPREDLNGDVLASTGNDGRVFLWNIATRQAITQVQLTAPGVSLAFSPDGKLAVGKADGTIDLRDADSLELTGSLLEGHTGPVLSLVFSDYGDALFSGGEDHQIIRWNLTTSPTVTKMKADGKVVALATAGDDYVAVGEENRDVFDIRGSQDLERKMYVPVAPRGRPLLVAWDPISKTVVYASSNNDLSGWDWQQATVNQPLRDYEGQIDSAAYRHSAQSADGLQYVSSLDGTILVWATDPTQRLVPNIDLLKVGDEACKLAGRNLSVEEWHTYMPDVPYRKVCAEFPAEN